MKILYFSSVNWKWIKQRPHFISYYMAQLKHEVDYMSLTPFGKTRISKFKQGHLNVSDSYVLPYANKFKFIRKINQRFIRFKLSLKKYDVVILTNPLHYLYLPDSFFRESIVIYECMDNIPFFYEGKLRDMFLQEEIRMFGKMDGVVVSSEYLKRELKTRLPAEKKDMPIQLISNAMDKDTMQRKPNKINLKSPNLVYIGTLSRWIDWDVLRKFARTNPDYTVYLVGPLEIRFKEKLEPNIILVGAIEHGEVSDYIFSGNIMLLPFLQNELTKAVDPVKMYEYLAYKKPVISSYWRELERFSGKNVHFYNNYQEFEALIRNIGDQEPHQIERDDDFIAEHNWIKRIEQYLRFIKMLKHKQKLDNKGLRKT